MRRLVFAVALCLVGLAKPAWPQQVDGDLEGRVLESSGTPVEDVRVVVSGPALQGTRWISTDREGAFRILALPVGTYTVQLSRVGYQELTWNDVPIQLGRTTSLGDIQLKRAVVEIPQVVVAGQRSMIDPTTASQSLTLPASIFEALPSDRDFHSLVALAPQANASYLGDDVNISGSTGEGNYYFIDGTDATDPIAGGTSINLPYNFIRAIEIKTGGYEAEYGRALGGIVNVITPSGGNERRVETFGYFTNHRLVSPPRNSLLETRVGQFASYDFGGVVSGPLVHDRLWWFAAYNPASDSRDAPVPGIAMQEDSKRIHRFAGKLTWRATPRTRLNLNVLGDPSRHRMVGVPFGFASPPDQVFNADAVVADISEGGFNVTLNGMHQLRPNVLVKGSLSRVRNRFYVTPISEVGKTEPFYNDMENNTVSGGYGVEHRNHHDRTAARVNASVFLGRHTVKGGLEYTDNSITDDIRFGAGRGGGGFVYRTNDTVFTWFQGFGKGTVHLRVPTAYVQDSWAVDDRLRVNAGLRWDGNYLVNSEGATALEITDGFQPRIGFTYEPGRRGTQKVFGSYGRFYEQLPTGSPGYYFFDSIQLYISYDHDPLVDASGGDTTKLLPSPPGVRDVEGQYFDEYILGYEREVASQLKLGVRARHRELGQVIEDAYSVGEDRFLIGNPGRGALSDYPEAVQRYTALEFTLEKLHPRGGFLASYVLSRNRGNYSGLVSGNAGPQFDFLETTVNAVGLLPNDRMHVFKLHGSYRSDFGLTSGATWIWQSGTPVSELGGVPGLPYTMFLEGRGSEGRTPSLWDLNLRFTYDLFQAEEKVKPKLTLDLFHLFSPRRAILLDERKYFAADEDGNQIGLNPDFLEPILYQPAFSARLGAIVQF